MGQSSILTTFVDSMHANQYMQTNNDIYEHVVTTYQSTLNSLVNSDNSMHNIHTINMSRLLNTECRPQTNETKELNCKFNTKCNKTYAQKLYQYPNFSEDELIQNNNFKLQSQFIKNLKYLIVSHHGGTHIATLSYLTNILKVPSANVAHICSGLYCQYGSKFQHYYNYFNATLSTKFRLISKELVSCCWRLSQGYWNKIDLLEKLQSQMYNIMDHIPKEDKIDVLICTFPSTQCAWLLPFAKVVVVRFMHRFNHHVWLRGQVKWGRLIHSMSHYCGNMILTASNAYDWYYTKHFLNLKTDSFLLWPNFARHFVDSFMPNMSTNVSTNDYNNISNFIFTSLTTCPELLNVSNVKYTLKYKHNINIWNQFIYNKKLLHNHVGGIIGVPHSVHGAKWVEYYSVGIQLFLPSLKFWIEMNDKCTAIPHRQAGNRQHGSPGRRQPTDAFGNYVEHSPCCGISPIFKQYQHIWLQFSDFYMDENFLKYIIYFDSSDDLMNKIVEYNNLSVLEKLKKKQIQMNEFTLLSKRFAPHLINALYNSYQKSDMECNLKLNALTKCLVMDPYNL